MSETMSVHGKIAFGEFTLDLDRCELLRAGEVLPLRPKSFDVLHYLLSHAGRVVSREELIEGGWPGLIVTDDSLTQCLVDIRRALGDDNHSIVRTIPRRGYSFDLSVDLLPEKDGDGQLQSPTGQLNFHRFLYPALTVLVVLAVAALATWRVVGDRSNSAPMNAEITAQSTAKSVAVLPFTDLSPHGDHEYLADGLAEEILNLLANIEQLDVIARTSSFGFRDKSVDVESIGRELNVAFVLEGSVRTEGDRIRVTAQLVDTATEMHVWSESYDQDLSIDNLLDIQERTATSIADALGEKILNLAPPKSNSARGPLTIAALDSYFQGQMYLRQIETGHNTSDEVFESAVKKFEASIAADPEWAPAHVALGRTYHFWLFDHPDHLDIAKSQVLEGLRLDNEFAPAYESLGYILYRQRDFEGSMQAYQRHFELGGDMTWGYAILLGSIARFDESVDAYRSAIEKDPLSSKVWAQFADILLCAARYTEAEQALDELMSTNPESPYIQLRWMEAKLRVGQPAPALALIDRISVGEHNSAYLSALYSLAGLDEPAGKMLAEAISDPDSHPIEIAWAAELAGDRDLALETLERAASEKPDSLLWLRCPPELRALAGNSRYEAVLDQVGFPR